MTFDKEDARSMLKDEKMYSCYYPTNRNFKNLIKNTFVAWKVLRKEKPDILRDYLLSKKKNTTQANPSIYIEVFDRVDKPTLTGRLVYPIVDEFIVQWEEQLKVYPKAKNFGSIF